MTKPRDAQPDDSYVDKLGKILPAELTATYFLIRTQAGDNPRLTLYLQLMALALCVVFYLIAPRLLRMSVPTNRILVLPYLCYLVPRDRSGALRHRSVPLQRRRHRRLRFRHLWGTAIWSFAVPHLMKQEGT